MGYFHSADDFVEAIQLYSCDTCRDIPVCCVFINIRRAPIFVDDRFESIQKKKSNVTLL